MKMDGIREDFKFAFTLIKDAYEIVDTGQIRNDRDRIILADKLLASSNYLTQIVNAYLLGSMNNAQEPTNRD